MTVWRIPEWFLVKKNLNSCPSTKSHPDLLVNDEMSMKTFFAETKLFLPRGKCRTNTLWFLGWFPNQTKSVGTTPKEFSCWLITIVKTTQDILFVWNRQTSKICRAVQRNLAVSETSPQSQCDQSDTGIWTGARHSASVESLCGASQRAPEAMFLLGVELIRNGINS